MLANLFVFSVPFYDEIAANGLTTAKRQEKELKINFYDEEGQEDAAIYNTGMMVFLEWF